MYVVVSGHISIPKWGGPTSENTFYSTKNLATSDRISLNKIQNGVFLAIRGQTLTNFVNFENKVFGHHHSYLSKHTSSLKVNHKNTLHVGSSCVKLYLTKYFAFIPCTQLIIGIKIIMWKFLCHFGHALYKSGQILSSGNIIFAFSTTSFVGTTNFMLVACLLWPENNF